MFSSENGVLPPSDFYFFTPSAISTEVFLYLLGCGNFHCTIQYNVKRDNYNNFLIMYVNSGICGVETNNNVYEAKEGELVILDCHKPHCYYAITPMEIFWMHFDGNMVRDLYQMIVKNNGIVFPNHSNYSFVGEIKRLLLECRRGRRLSTEAVTSWIIYRILCEFINKPMATENTAIRGDSILNLIDYINKNYADNITLKDMSKAANLSPYHLSRVFKTHTGYSPYEFLIVTRIDKAKHLLKTTEMPIKEIVYEVGFGSEINFTTSFSTRVGISPKKFRQYPF